MAIARLSAAYALCTKMPWGDYGAILAEGFTVEPFRRDGSLVLHRTGPFVPPLSLPPGSHVAADAFRHRLESRFPELRFVPVIKDKIAEFHWETWDRNAADPVEYPVDMEPESYIDERPHSEIASCEMGGLWEVVMPDGGDARWVSIENTFRTRIHVLASTWTGRDWFKIDRSRVSVVSEAGRAWLEKEVGDWIGFEQLEID